MSIYWVAAIERGTNHLVLPPIAVVAEDEFKAKFKALKSAEIDIDAVDIIVCPFLPWYSNGTSLFFGDVTWC